METINTSGNQVLMQQSNGGSKNIITKAENKSRKYTNWWGKWSYKNEQLINEKTGQVITATDKPTEGGQIFVRNANNSSQQKW